MVTSCILEGFKSLDTSSSSGGGCRVLYRVLAVLKGALRVDTRNILRVVRV